MVLNLLEFTAVNKDKSNLLRASTKEVCSFSPLSSHGNDPTSFVVEKQMLLA